MSGLSEQERACTCAHVDGYRIPSRSCPTHGPSMQPPRPAHEDPLRLTFTRDELDAAVAAAREEARQEALAPLAVAIAEMDAWAKSFHPDNYRTGQDHLPLAFRAGYRAAMNVLMQRFDQFVEGLRPLAADIRKGDDRG